MKQSRAAKRYARALLDLSIERNTLEECYVDMQLVFETCLKSREFSIFLKSPIVKTDKKREIISEIFDSKIQDITRSFIDIIVSKKRESLLRQISDSFIDLSKIYSSS